MLMKKKDLTTSNINIKKKYLQIFVWKEHYKVSNGMFLRYKIKKTH